MCRAYPDYFVTDAINGSPQGFATTCTTHPTGPIRGSPHGGPIPDSNANFVIKDSSQTVVTSVCPGNRYSVAVNYGTRRRALLTVTDGNLGAGFNGCPNRAVLGSANNINDPASPSFTLSWAVPCSTTGASAEFKSTSVNSPAGSEWRVATLAVPISAACAAAACGGSGTTPTTPTTAPTAAPSSNTTTSGTGSTGGSGGLEPDDDHTHVDDSKGHGNSEASGPIVVTPSPSPSPAPSTAPATTDTTTTTGSSASDGGAAVQESGVVSMSAGGTTNSSSSNSTGCAPSYLGYECMQDISSQVRLHWSVKSAKAPVNPCTAGQASQQKHAANNASSVNTTSGVLHMAAESKAAGYVAVAFAETAGVMGPADIVLGFLDGGNAPQVYTYYVTGSGLVSRDRLPDPSWAYDRSALRTSNGTLVMCFSRALVDARAKVSPDLSRILASADSKMSGGGAAPGRHRRALFQQATATTDSGSGSGSKVAINWAVSDTPALIQHRAADANGLEIDLASGSAGPSAGGAGDRRVRMIAHGALMAAAWALLLPLGVLLPAHRWLFGGERVRMCGSALWFRAHVACQLLGFAAFIAGIVLGYRLDYKNANKIKVHNTHYYLGTIILALASAQVLFGVLRPNLHSTVRRYWNLLHWNLGRLVILAAWANIFIGIYLFKNSIYAGRSDKVWLGPVIASIATIFAVHVVLSLLGWWTKKAEESAVLQHGSDSDSGDQYSSALDHQNGHHGGGKNSFQPVAEGHNGHSNGVDHGNSNGYITHRNSHHGANGNGAQRWQEVELGPPTTSPTAQPGVVPPPVAGAYGHYLHNTPVSNNRL